MLRDVKLKSKNSDIDWSRTKSLSENAGRSAKFNGATYKILQRKASCPCGGGCPHCQTKNTNLPVSQPNDALEIEADQIADKVMRMPKPFRFSPSENKVNRKRAEREEDEKGKKLHLTENHDNTYSFAPPVMQDVLSSGGKPLDTRTRRFMESRFNYDFGNVKIHDNDLAAKSASSINALAYTSGNNIVFNSGQYNANSDSGKKLLAHELTHVIQQRDYRGKIQRQEDDKTKTTPCPTSVSIGSLAAFNHSSLSADDKDVWGTYLGVVSQMQVGPGPDHSGHCMKEKLTTVSNDCPKEVYQRDGKETSPCIGDKCLDINRYGSSGDPSTKSMVKDDPTSFIDLHRTRNKKSLLDGTGKNACSVVCEQIYSCDRTSATSGKFKITRNFKADKHTKKDGTQVSITTGEIKKEVMTAKP